LLLLPSAILAATVTYDFNITWAIANPDGQFSRRTIGINGKWPIPTIEVNRGDRLVVNMHNGLGDQDTSLHFHGLFQNGTGYMDGPAGVTQCPVGPGQSIKYDFVVCTYDPHLAIVSSRCLIRGNTRSTNRERTGTIRMYEGNTRMASVGH
jgi:iron transport multicopper oxidase